MDRELLGLIMFHALISLGIISFAFLVIMLLWADAKHEPKSKRGDK